MPEAHLPSLQRPHKRSVHGLRHCLPNRSRTADPAASKAVLVQGSFLWLFGGHIKASRSVPKVWMLQLPLQKQIQARTLRGFGRDCRRMLHRWILPLRIDVGYYRHLPRRHALLAPGSPIHRQTLPRVRSG